MVRFLRGPSGIWEGGMRERAVGRVLLGDEDGRSVLSSLTDTQAQTSINHRGSFKLCYYFLLLTP